MFKELWDDAKRWVTGANIGTPKESWFDIMIQTVKDFFSSIGDKMEQMGISLFSGELKEKYDQMTNWAMNAYESLKTILKDGNVNPRIKSIIAPIVNNYQKNLQGGVGILHDGGFVQDVPAILQSGEYVVSRRGVQSAMANGGRVPQLDLGGMGGTGNMGAPPIINNIVNNNSSSNVSNLSNTVARPFSELYAAFTQ